MGILCLHIILVLKDAGLEELHDRYVPGRWIKQACLKLVFVIDGVLCERSVQLE